MVISSAGDYYAAWPCDKLDWTLSSRNKTLTRYPVCEKYYDGTWPSQAAPVLANFVGDHVEEIGAALDLAFGMSAWVALALHAIGVEIYVRDGYIISVVWML
jgi:hypothetical protein